MTVEKYSCHIETTMFIHTCTRKQNWHKRQKTAVKTLLNSKQYYYLKYQVVNYIKKITLQTCAKFLSLAFERKIDFTFTYSLNELILILLFFKITFSYFGLVQPHTFWAISVFSRQSIWLNVDVCNSPMKTHSYF